MGKYVIFHVEGGLGKNVASTSVVKSISEKYNDRKLIVVASFPEVFLNNPHIHRVYRIGVTPYFWNDYIKDKDTIVLKREPYSEAGHISGNEHLIETWHKMYNLDYDKDKNIPELHMNMIQSSLGNMWNRDRPTMVLHSHGGGMIEGQPLYSWTRDIPYSLLDAIVNELGHQYHIFQICKDERQVIRHPSVEPVIGQMSNFEFFSILHTSAKRVLVDSALQHASAALNLPSVVLWIGTPRNVFGYDIHYNIEANPPDGSVKLPDSQYFEYQLSGVVHECPYTNVDEMFDIEKVVEQIKQF